MVACSFSPCSQLFVTGSTYGDLRVWDLDLNQLHAEKNAHDLGVTCCAFAPNILSGQRQSFFFYICTLSSAGCNYREEKSKAQSQLGVPQHSQWPPNSDCLFADSQVVQFHFASCGQDSHVKIWAMNKLSSGGKPQQKNSQNTLGLGCLTCQSGFFVCHFEPLRCSFCTRWLASRLLSSLVHTPQMDNCLSQGKEEGEEVIY